MFYVSFFLRKRILKSIAPFRGGRGNHQRFTSGKKNHHHHLEYQPEARTGDDRHILVYHFGDVLGCGLSWFCFFSSCSSARFFSIRISSKLCKLGQLSICKAGRLSIYRVCYISPLRLQLGESSSAFFGEMPGRPAFQNARSPNSRGRLSLQRSANI